MRKILIILITLAFAGLACAQTSNLDIDGNSTVDLFEGVKICVDDINVQSGSSFTAYDYGQVNEGDCTTTLTPGGNGTVTLPVEITDIESLPNEFTLKSAYPNPFNPTTTIQYGIPDARDVSIMIYDLMGRKVTTLYHDEQEAGWYEITWNGLLSNGSLAPAGMYLFKIIAYNGLSANEIKTSKITLVK